MKTTVEAYPLADYQAHREALDAALREVAGSGWYIMGERVEAFESSFAAFCGSKQAIAVANGTDAIELSLRALDIGAGDQVATVSHTAFATVSAIMRVGAMPVFVDIDPQTFTMSSESLREVLELDCEKRIRAVIPVHLYGQMAEMPAICSLAQAHGCRILEDSAQAHGALQNNESPGTQSDVATYSFYPTKNLGALGDAGAITTQNADLAERLRSLREYGWHERYISDEAGVNSRMDSLQAAVLSVKLNALSRSNERRRVLAARYDEALSGVLSVPKIAAGNHHVYHLYVARHPDRDRFLEYLRSEGVPAAIHYPQAVHTQPAMAENGQTVSLEQTEAAVREIISLPLHPYLSDEAQDEIIELIRAF